MAKASNLILLNDCLKLYEDLMHDAVDNADPFFTQPKLLDAHDKSKDGSLTKVKFIATFI